MGEKRNRKGGGIGREAAGRARRQRTVDGVAASSHPLFQPLRRIQRSPDVLDDIEPDWMDGDVHSVADMIEHVLETIGNRPGPFHHLRPMEGDLGFKRHNLWWIYVAPVPNTLAGRKKLARKNPAFFAFIESTQDAGLSECLCDEIRQAACAGSPRPCNWMVAKLWSEEV